MGIKIDNATQLKTEVDAYAKRTVSTGQFDQLVNLAEKRIVRAFAKNGLQNKMVATKTLTATSSTVSLPASARAIEVLYLDTSPKQVLSYMSPDAFFNRYLSNETGKPKAYTIQGKVIHLGPAPDDTYSVVCWFRQDLDIKRSRDMIMAPEQNYLYYSLSGDYGSFTGGSGYAVGDQVTFSNGAVIEVTQLSTTTITQFDPIETSFTTLVDDGETLTQSSTTGSGTGATLTLGQNNLTNAVLIDHPELYLYGTLIETYLFYRNETELAKYTGLFAEAIESLAEDAFNVGGPMQIYNPDASAGAPKLRR